MTYRDELDALRAKNERLSEELADARAELEKRDHPPEPRTPPWWRAHLSFRTVLIGVALIVVGGAVWFFLFSERETRQAVAFWHARVVSAEGVYFPPGTACLVRGGMKSDGTSHVAADIRVRCGTRVLYDASSATALSCEVGEVPTDAQGLYAYWLRCQDPGVEPDEDDLGRAGLTLDTRGRTATLTVHGTPGWRIVLAVDEASTQRRGTPLYDGNVQGSSSFARVVRAGRVTTVTRGAPASVGSACTVGVVPVDGSLNCHVTVACGGHELYGGGSLGFTHCNVAEDAPTTAHDTKGTAAEGDPMLDLDLPGRSVVVSDDAPHAYSVTIALDP